VSAYLDGVGARQHVARNLEGGDGPRRIQNLKARKDQESDDPSHGKKSWISVIFANAEQCHV
jgi:hypothetical protein